MSYDNYCGGLKDAIRRWDNEVEDEAMRLIERGTPPYEAIQQARDIVSRKRREAQFKAVNV